eukprot:TRINITY_DN6234_c0_g2_i2.p1 TRINITY_DN6234_c0_g2~~TRINITY_DN6234_c0_g2_i2.p1  ORF type:complete len:1313 (-),score=281.65 TRINITY_DN6234_c0_g2_i2:51-3989(-)
MERRGRQKERSQMPRFRGGSCLALKLAAILWLPRAWALSQRPARNLLLGTNGSSPGLEDWRPEHAAHSRISALAINSDGEGEEERSHRKTGSRLFSGVQRVQVNADAGEESDGVDWSEDTTLQLNVFHEDHMFGEIIHNNLGGMGPNFDHPPEIRYWVPYINATMVIENLTEYVPANPTINGKNGPFGIINLAPDQVADLSFHFDLVDENNKSTAAKTVEDVILTFVDIDMGNGGQSTESIAGFSFSEFYVFPDNFTKPLQALGWAEPGKTGLDLQIGPYLEEERVIAQKQGLRSDNPVSPDILTIEQLRKCVWFEYHALNAFHVEIGVTPGKKGRNFMFAIEFADAKEAFDIETTTTTTMTTTTKSESTTTVKAGTTTTVAAPLPEASTAAPSPETSTAAPLSEAEGAAPTTVPAAAEQPATPTTTTSPAPTSAPTSANITRAPPLSGNPSMADVANGEAVTPAPADGSPVQFSPGTVGAPPVAAEPIQSAPVQSVTPSPIAVVDAPPVQGAPPQAANGEPRNAAPQAGPVEPVAAEPQGPLAMQPSNAAPPVEGPQAANGVPLVTPQPANGEPMDPVPKAANGMPLTPPQIANGEPVAPPQAANGMPLNPPETANGEPMQPTAASASGAKAMNGTAEKPLYASAADKMAAAAAAALQAGELPQMASADAADAANAAAAAPAFANAEAADAAIANAAPMQPMIANANAADGPEGANAQAAAMMPMAAAAANAAPMDAMPMPVNAEMADALNSDAKPMSAEMANAMMANAPQMAAMAAAISAMDPKAQAAMAMAALNAAQMAEEGLNLTNLTSSGEVSHEVLAAYYDALRAGSQRWWPLDAVAAVFAVAWSCRFLVELTPRGSGPEAKAARTAFAAAEPAAMLCALFVAVAQRAEYWEQIRVFGKVLLGQAVPAMRPLMFAFLRRPFFGQNDFFGLLMKICAVAFVLAVFVRLFLVALPAAAKGFSHWFRWAGEGWAAEPIDGQIREPVDGEGANRAAGSGSRRNQQSSLCAQLYRILVAVMYGCVALMIIGFFAVLLPGPPSSSGESSSASTAARVGLLQDGREGLDDMVALPALRRASTGEICAVILAALFLGSRLILHICINFCTTLTYSRVKLAILSTELAPMLAILLLALAYSSSPKQAGEKYTTAAITSTACIFALAILEWIVPSLSFNAGTGSVTRSRRLLHVPTLVRWAIMAVLYTGVWFLCKRLWNSPCPGLLYGLIAGYFVVQVVLWFIRLTRLWEGEAGRLLADADDVLRPTHHSAFGTKALGSWDMVATAAGFLPMIAAYVLAWWLFSPVPPPPLSPSTL